MTVELESRRYTIRRVDVGRLWKKKRKKNKRINSKINARGGVVVQVNYEKRVRVMRPESRTYRMTYGYISAYRRVCNNMTFNVRQVQRCRLRTVWLIAISTRSA